MLTDWVLYSQNIFVNYYAEAVLVHGDKELLPLLCDRVNHADTKQVLDGIRDKKVIIPRSDFMFQKDDRVVFIAKNDSIPTVENIFRLS